MSRLIKKAVFPVAGLGSRFLPATKAQPKEMLPIVDKPLIQYAVEEAVEAGITEMIFITGRNKQLLEMVRGVIPKNVNCMYIRQPMALGLGHAVLCAKPIVGDDAFAVLLADDFMQGEHDGPGVMAQMTATFAREQSSLLGVQNVPRAHTKQYGIVSTEPFGERLEKVGAIVEKPAPELAPSTLAVVGRYVLTPRIFSCLEKIGKGAGGEIQLTDGIEALMQYETVLAYRYQGRRFDCGSKLGYLQASVEIGLQHAETGAAFADWLGQRG
jgi:UTP--glucose-1-phosphate uridylyltransferase